MHIKTKYFPFLLAFSAIIVESCAAFFSVYGLTKLFSGAVIAVGIMAGSLEIAKVVSATYLYRHWSNISKLFKTYFSLSVVILMFITSLGIYGFLNNAFQSSTLGMEKESTKLSIYQDEISRLKEQNESIKQDKASVQKALTDELNGLVVKEESRYLDANKRASAVKRYQPMITEKDNMISSNNVKISALSDSMSNLKMKMIDTGMDVGPIIFVARAFDTDVSTVVQYLIILFIIVFDPLALALVVAFNQVIIQKYEEYKEVVPSRSEPQPIKEDGLVWQGKQSEPIVVPEEPIIQDTPPISQSQEGLPQNITTDPKAIQTTSF